MHYSIDRFEEDIAVLQDSDGQSRDVPRAELPSDVAQGDILIYKDGSWLPDRDETTRRRDRVRQLQERLLNKRKK